MNTPQKVTDTRVTDNLYERLGIHSPAKLEQLLLEVETLLRAAPPEPSIKNIQSMGPDLGWVGAASAVISQWSSTRAITFQFAQTKFADEHLPTRIIGHRTVMMLLHEAQRDLRLKTVGPLNVAIDKGRVFDYFEELKEIIKQATADLLFVDAYLSDEFISRYLPHVKDGLTIRLLTSPGRDARYLNKLLPAVDLFTTQHSQTVSVRTTDDLHDRYLLIDGSRCFSSGASFKDGAKNAGTTITQIVDVFEAVQRVYEGLWATGKVER